jgi:hypothetical protein
MLSCGVDAACNWGAPVVPAFKRAMDAINANPEKSNRMIAGSDRYCLAAAIGSDCLRERSTW